MYAFGTERRRRRLTARANERGAVLVGTLIVFSGILGMVYLTTISSIEEAKASRRGIEDIRTKFLAEAGVERAFYFLNDAVDKTNLHDPIEGLSNIFGGAPSVTLYAGEPLMDGEVASGEYTVTLSLEQQDAQSITMTIDATGYLPAAPMNLAPGDQLESWQSVSVSVVYALEPSQVFDYGYFINNWGWFYGNTIECYGNARSNGQFDAAGYKPLVNGQPTYDGIEWTGASANLVGFRDYNGDGVNDGTDGGIFSGWDIVGASKVRGQGGSASSQYDFSDSIEMPNLTDLTSYETTAVAEGGGVKIAGSKVTDAVYGDDAGETGNLYLYGTKKDPIELDGPLVVRGDVIISGYVTGQGTIYAGGNVYVPDSITYSQAPSTDRPPHTKQSSTEAWITANNKKDFLGLFARENIVVGDYTHSWWQSYVGKWMNDPMNRSDEDAGEDRIPNTAAGIDGKLGTSDDDVLEGDGKWTVEYYSADDAALGLIPPGYTVGDPIPGSGEDIDGDGQMDGTTTLADMAIKSALNTTNWGGNMPAGGIAKYSDIATLYANNLDAVFYTNHSFSYVVLGSKTAKINGAIVCRNENIVYGTPSIEINYDCRLLGGNYGLAASLLPKGKPTPSILTWRRQTSDPNRYVGIE